MAGGAAEYSVLMSVYAGERAEYFERSLECVLGQSVPPEQVVVVRDGALTSGLDSVLSRFEDGHPGIFTVVGYAENKGLWHALNVGLAACRNELVMRMDTDDCCSPQRAALQLAVFAERPECGCVGSLVAEFTEDMGELVACVELPEENAEIRAFGRRRYPLRHSALMYKKSAVLAAGGYRQMPYFEDYDLYMRMAAAGCVFYNIQKSLVCMRAGRGFYARRGGLSYLGHMVRFKTACLRHGDMGAADYAISTFPHVVVCLLPNRLRELVYRRFLRGGAPR